MVRDNIELEQRLAFLQNAVGAAATPFNSFLALRGLETLAIRMELHIQNGLELASWMSCHLKVDKVFYAGLPNHPHYELAKRQMTLSGGMISVQLKGIMLKTSCLVSRSLH